VLISAELYVCTYVCVLIYVCVCTYVRMYVCMYVCIYVRMCTTKESHDVTGRSNNPSNTSVEMFLSLREGPEVIPRLFDLWITWKVTQISFVTSPAVDKQFSGFICSR
jgi:hypothetical protein